MFRVVNEISKLFEIVVCVVDFVVVMIYERIDDEVFSFINENIFSIVVFCSI